MKRVRQEHGTACGIACVAMIAQGVTYSKVMKVARKLFDWNDSQRAFYTSSAQLRKLLLAFKVQTKKCRAVRKWSSLPDTAIVGVNYNEKTNTLHWVVFRREAAIEYVLDPRTKSDIRKDFSRMRLSLCIPIDLTPRASETAQKRAAS
jgi:ABC-type bacteriocin/lantibiotic exporter with double-glycine peptidase domain